MKTALGWSFTVLLLPVAIAAIISSAATSADPGSQSLNLGAAEPADPNLVVGNEACIKCHAADIQVWKKTPHATTLDELHRRPEAKAIASKLGLNSIKNSGRCVACHYTQQQTPETALHVISGVSCESCHGAAKNWLAVHHDFGGEGLTSSDESPAHRSKRIADSVKAGMRNPKNVYAVAQSCLRCHTTADEELVNIGGHSAGSLEFEFVSWSQGLIRHNFLTSDGKSNRVSSPERLRLMFVAGMFAELEASLRATAIATEKATFGVTSAKRASRAGARLASIDAKIDSPQLRQIVDIFKSIKLQLNNESQLTAAANQIAVLGHEFAESNEADLSSLDRFIPGPDRYK
ncbi:MAG: cytochrome C554 [Planctomycetaceae bacterium]|nr:cytochrome C554 [Planctomycetaceae bacterium]